MIFCGLYTVNATKHKVLSRKTSLKFLSEKLLTKWDGRFHKSGLNLDNWGIFCYNCYVTMTLLFYCSCVLFSEYLNTLLK